MPLTYSLIHSVLPSKNTLISEKLFYGYETREGFNIATPEKALLDTLYLRRHVPFIGELELDNLDIIKLMDLSKLYPMSVQKKVQRPTNPMVTSKSTPVCHSRNPESFRESGIFLQTKKDSGQAGMTDKKLKTKKRLLQQRVSFNNDMTVP